MTQKYTQGFDSRKSDFITKYVGRPYESGIYGIDTMNCYALAVKYFEAVHNMELDTLRNKSARTRAKLWAGVRTEVMAFEEIDKPEPESIALTGYRAGNPTHVGVIISPSKVLHAAGVDGTGCVQISSLRSFLFNYGKTTYHRVRK